MTVLNRKDVRGEIGTSLGIAIGSENPAKAIYVYMHPQLEKQSPVVLVLGNGIQRTPAGLGVVRYDNLIALELHYLVYDGADNPLEADEREDKLDDVEAAVADWCRTHRDGTTYRNLIYTPVMTQATRIKYIDGNPYLLEVALIHVEGRDPS